MANQASGAADGAWSPLDFDQEVSRASDTRRFSRDGVRTFYAASGGSGSADVVRLGSDVLLSVINCVLPRMARWRYEPDESLIMLRASLGCDVVFRSPGVPPLVFNRPEVTLVCQPAGLPLSVDITGGGLGMLIPMKAGVANFQFAERSGFYFLILALAAGSVALAEWLRHSRFGAQLAAIRENEDAAKALGINVFVEKVKVMLISGAIGGIGGCFFAQYFLYIDPLIVFGVDKSVEMLLVSMIGGAGTVYGPLVGALLLALVSDATRLLTQIQGLSLVLYGALLVVIIAYLPNGLIDLFRRKQPVAKGKL